MTGIERQKNTLILLLIMQNVRKIWLKGIIFSEIKMCKCMISKKLQMVELVTFFNKFI